MQQVGNVASISVIEMSSWLRIIKLLLLLWNDGIKMEIQNGTDTGSGMKLETWNGTGNGMKPET